MEGKGDFMRWFRLGFDFSGSAKKMGHNEKKRRAVWRCVAANVIDDA